MERGEERWATSGLARCACARAAGAGWGRVQRLGRGQLQQCVCGSVPAAVLSQPQLSTDDRSLSGAGGLEAQRRQ